MNILKKMTINLRGTLDNISKLYHEKKLVIKYNEKTMEVNIGGYINEYTVIKLIGRGEYGYVYQAQDRITREMVAIKIFRNDSSHLYKHSAGIENYFLKLLKNNPYVVKIIKPLDYQDHRMIVFEYLSHNLYNAIKITDGLPMKIVCNIGYQLVNFLNTMIPHNIIHRDLKPENILLVENNGMIKNQIKVIDFGLAAKQSNQMKHYIQSRYYRAPEVILELPYNHMIDMWSVGCILAELFTTIPIFPGRDSIDQLHRIVSIMGDIPQEMLDGSKREFKNSELKYEKISLDEIFNVNNFGEDKAEEKKQVDTFVDLLKQMLQIDPKLRITSEKASYHPFFQLFPKPDNTNKRKHDDNSNDEQPTKSFNKFERVSFHL